ncbi:hypothetical protein NDU88_004072 [Pleurodeles waltl]|uniref:Uncharacterized protein n=1 Tax=Pleurodeles waltl TaxID=8319 RepID=A0AAV7T8A1_PLEWA|nr:hypothetical protein NDU88_004072 [Pleurodeles waltl]
MTSQCSLPLPKEDQAGPSGLAKRGSAKSPKHTQKHAGVEDAPEAFTCLTNAFLGHHQDPDSHLDKPDESLRSSDVDIDPEGRAPLPHKSHGSVEVPPDDMLNPDDLFHPRSAEWLSAPKVAAYAVGRLRKPLDKEVQNHLKVECPRPSLQDKVALTPKIDTNMETFLGKFIKDPKKGINWSCQANSWTLLAC